MHTRRLNERDSQASSVMALGHIERWMQANECSYATWKCAACHNIHSAIHVVDDDGDDADDDDDGTLTRLYRWCCLCASKAISASTKRVACSPCMHVAQREPDSIIFFNLKLAFSTPTTSCVTPSPSSSSALSSRENAMATNKYSRDIQCVALRTYTTGRVS